MRPFLFIAILACSCTSVDPLIGSFDVTVSGMDNQTAPTTSTSSVGGTGYLAITGMKADPEGYLVHFGQDGYSCSFKGKKTEALTIDIPDMQTCKLNNFTFTTTNGKVTMDKETMTNATLTVSYTYAGVLVFNFSGTGTRNYAGPRL